MGVDHFSYLYSFSVMAYFRLRSRMNARIKNSEDFSAKISMYYHMFNHWLKLKQAGVSCKDFFIINAYKRIAIYGYKEFGERLYDELRNSEVEVVCIIDKNKGSVCADVQVYSSNEEIPEVDAIVVTPAFYYAEIEEDLSRKVNCPIISIEDVIL